MSDETDPDTAANRQRASRAGMQPVTNTSPSGAPPPATARPEIGLDDLNPTQMEAWLALVEIVFGADDDEA